MRGDDSARKLDRFQDVEVEGRVVVLQDPLQPAAHPLQLEQLRHRSMQDRELHVKTA